MAIAVKPLIHLQLALFLILSGLYGLSPSYTEMKKLYLGLWNPDTLAPRVASSSFSAFSLSERQGRDGAALQQPETHLSSSATPADAAHSTPEVPARPAVRQGGGADDEPSYGQGRTGWSERSTGGYASARGGQPGPHQAPALREAHRPPAGGHHPLGELRTRLRARAEAEGGLRPQATLPLATGGTRQRLRSRIYGRARGQVGAGAGADMPSLASKLSASERASFFMWADPFTNTSGRPAVTDEPPFDAFLNAMVGPCTVVLPTPSRKAMKTSGMIFVEGMRAAVDTRMKSCLMEQRADRPRQSWLFGAVLGGLSSTCEWLTEHGAEPLRPFQDSEIAECLSSNTARFGRRNSWGIFQPQSFTTATAGKNAVQLAIQLGLSDIVRRWATAETVIDDRGRTVADYLRSPGSAVLPDEASRDFGISVERRTSESPTSDATGTLECQDGQVPVQWVGWPRSSSFEPYGKCDMDVVTSLTRQEYLSEYWAKGRPVLVRSFIPAEDLCRGTRTSLMRHFGETSFHVGPQAYPAISGTTYCESRFTLEQLEHGAYCDTHPGVSNYQAMKQEGDAMPFRLTSSKTFERIREILAISEDHLNSKQFFFGGDKSGATLHFHAAAFNLLHVGQKDWFLVPPSHTAFAGIPSYQLWERAGTDMRHVVRCTQQAGDMLLLPEYWGHATLSHGFSAGLGVLYERKAHRRDR